jgi:hypothetical protein
LARLEGQLALRSIVEGMPEITLASEAVEWNMSVALRGLRRFM